MSSSALAVGAVEVQRRAAHLLVGNAGGVELLLEVVPACRLDRERDVVEPAEHLRVVAEVEPREVEEGEEVAVADVEEEVRRALVVAVLEQLGERELEEILIERDGRLDVSGQQCDVVHTARRRGLALLGRPQMAGPHRLPLRAAVHVVTVSHHRSSRRRSIPVARETSTIKI